MRSTGASRCARRGETRGVDVVGPVCESGDFLALDREWTTCSRAILAVCDVGAYGYVDGVELQRRPRPAEVLVDGARFAVITQREEYDDLDAARSGRPPLAGGA